MWGTGTAVSVGENVVHGQGRILETHQALHRKAIRKILESEGVLVIKAG